MGFGGFGLMIFRILGRLRFAAKEPKPSLRVPERTTVSSRESER